MNKRIIKKSQNRVTKSELRNENGKIKNQLDIMDKIVCEKLKSNFQLEENLEEKTNMILSLQEDIVGLGYISTSKTNEINELMEAILYLRSQLAESEKKKIGFFRKIFA